MAELDESTSRALDEMSLPLETQFRIQEMAMSGNTITQIAETLCVPYAVALEWTVGALYGHPKFKYVYRGTLHDTKEAMEATLGDVPVTSRSAADDVEDSGERHDVARQASVEEKKSFPRVYVDDAFYEEYGFTLVVALDSRGVIARHVISGKPTAVRFQQAFAMKLAPAIKARYPDMKVLLVTTQENHHTTGGVFRVIDLPLAHDVLHGEIDHETMLEPLKLFWKMVANRMRRAQPRFDPDSPAEAETQLLSIIDSLTENDMAGIVPFHVAPQAVPPLHTVPTAAEAWAMAAGGGGEMMSSGGRRTVTRKGLHTRAKQSRRANGPNRAGTEIAEGF